MISRNAAISACSIAASLGYFALAGCARSGSGTPVMPLTPSSRVIDFETHEGTRLAFDISPDGREIVFDLLGQVWVLPAGGGDARPITNSVDRMSVDLDPAWSPDGEWIAFQGDEGAARGIWLVRPDGTGLRRLTDSTMSPASSPAWSPDGKRLAYVTRDSIRIVYVADGTTRALRLDSLDRGPIRTPVWSPDGSRIAFAHGAGRIMEVSSEGGRPTAVTATTLRASSPAYSRDAARLAFLVDSLGARQLWIQEIKDTVARQLAPHRDLTNLRVRWSPTGDTLLYSADGRLWRRALSAPTSEEIPFTARVRFARREPPLRDVTFPKPGAEMRARGFLGLALSPDGDRAAMIALGKLWLIATADGATREVAPMPFTANGLAWSPDGSHVAWSAGAGGSEDIWVTNVESGATRRVIALAGREERASWSPDGQWIAFVHWPKAMCDTPPSRYDDECGLLRLRAARVGDSTVERLEDTRLLATPGVFSWTFTFFGEGQEIPQWSSGSDGVFFSAGGRISFAPLEGTARPVGRIPSPSTFVHVRADTSVVFVRGNQLWSVRSPGAREVLLSPDPALYPSFARDGRILFLSSDGLRVRLP
ncbi:MAG TPA: LpqB family beta-propeller domain-containing protein, partial [Candidatus Limnocylindria bacterium]|nr:LpqB family beta-propeller domain-containing protein [Candidatus Limnocylindria bacterium]